MVHIDEVLEAHTPKQTSVELCIDGSINRRIQALLSEYERAQSDDGGSLADDRAQDIYDRLSELREQARQSTVEFVFEAVGDLAWDRLIGEHQPTEDQREADDYHLDYDVDRFPPAAIAASLVEPEGVDTDRVSKLQEALSAGQWRQLWTACVSANTGGDELGKDAAVTGLMNAIGSSSTTAPNGDSPAASSLAES